MGNSNRKPFSTPLVAVLCAGACLTFLAPPAEAGPRLEDKTLVAWDTYTTLTKKRVDLELDNQATFLRSDIAHLKKTPSSGAGPIQIQEMETKDKGKSVEIKGGAIHHWLGAVFIPNTTVDKVLALVQDYDHAADYFTGVEKSKLIAHPPKSDTYGIYLRLTQSKMGVTAKFNTEHTVDYRRHGPGRVSSFSKGTKIAQLESAGTPKERELLPGEDAGYLWRLNSYWRFAERDGGVVVECETVGLSRPLGSFYGFLNILMLGKVKQIAESVARESLEDTLSSLREGVRKFQDPKSLHVELDIFSGKPNPSWELNAADTAEFLKRFRALSADTSSRKAADGLGYRGLVVTAKEGLPDSLSSILLFKGLVIGRASGGARNVNDAGRNLERWLLGTGKSRLDPAIYNEAAKGL